MRPYRPFISFKIKLIFAHCIIMVREAANFFNGGGGNGRATKKRELFEALKKIPKKNLPLMEAAKQLFVLEARPLSGGGRAGH